MDCYCQELSMHLTSMVQNYDFNYECVWQSPSLKKASFYWSKNFHLLFILMKFLKGSNRNPRHPSNITAVLIFPLACVKCVILKVEVCTLCNKEKQFKTFIKMWEQVGNASQVGERVGGFLLTEAMVRTKI